MYRICLITLLYLNQACQNSIFFSFHAKYTLNMTSYAPQIHLWDQKIKQKLTINTKKLHSA